MLIDSMEFNYYFLKFGVPIMIVGPVVLFGILLFWRQLVELFCRIFGHAKIQMIKGQDLQVIMKCPRCEGELKLDATTYYSLKNDQKALSYRLNHRGNLIDAGHGVS